MLLVLFALVAAPESGVLPHTPRLMAAPMLAMAAEPGPSASRPAPPIVGGYAPISPRAPQLRPVLAAALPSLNAARKARARIVEAEQQVVAGMNYRLLVKLRDGSRWRVIVWQRLDGGYEVTEALRAD